jgi:hypothetical protein
VQLPGLHQRKTHTFAEWETMAILVSSVLLSGSVQARGSAEQKPNGLISWRENCSEGVFALEEWSQARGA